MALTAVLGAGLGDRAFRGVEDDTASTASVNQGVVAGFRMAPVAEVADASHSTTARKTDRRITDLMAARFVPSLFPRTVIPDAVVKSAPTSISHYSNTAPPAGFWGGTYTASNGQLVTIHASYFYAPNPENQAAMQSIAEFFARGLLHGPELDQLAVVVVVPPDAVQGNCGGSPGVLACYVANWRIMFIPGTAPPGISLPAIVAHEYGHHVSLHRLNTPWDAWSWGAKRWASYEDICTRTQQGTAFPGDEGPRYMLNPAEAFSETYRVVNEQGWGLTTFIWPIVDQSFFPDQGSLDAVRADVLTPWIGNQTVVRAGRFTKYGPRVRVYRFVTPLDGNYVVSIRSRGAYLNVRDGNTGTVIGSGRSVSATDCGGRLLQVDVVRQGKPSPFTVYLSMP